MKPIQALIVLLGYMSTAAAQDGNPTVIGLWPIAFDPIEVQNAAGLLVTDPEVTEYVVLRRVIYSEGTQPKQMDVVALIENTSDRDVRDVRLTLQVSRRVTDVEGAGREPPVGDWQDWDEVEFQDVSVIAARAVVKTVFAGIDVQSLSSDLSAAKRWPSEVRFRVVTQCGGCLPREGGATATVRIRPAG